MEVTTETNDNIQIFNSWKDLLFSEFQKTYMQNLKSFLKSEYKSKKTIYPKSTEVFAALNYTPIENVKVVILGQDPYHGPGQAHGLCFSVNEGIPNPPSLQNIFKERLSDLNLETPKHGNLSHWAKQGVLLLNATLTVEAHKAGSHQNKGWEEFTDTIIKLVNDKKENVVFILWGSYAQKKASFIDSKKHFVIKAPHPSPLSSYRGFFGSKPFSKTNSFLQSKKLTPINW
ncbi:MAG: uracil-DNA glycosylase [Bdellovibrionales bacterium]|nr:uracil-DNA glycosylase [Bdellovibrionales bacterium]